MISKMSSNEIVLSFHDSVIKKSDINILTGNDWLNDRLIGFYLQYLEKRVYPHRERDIAFVSPEVTHCIKLSSKSEVGIFVSPLKLSQKRLIIFPINNCLEQEAPGGSHWSLLIYFRPKNTFYHYDSFNQTNSDNAHMVMERVVPYLNQSRSSQFTQADCPQQRNSYDCGIHALCNAEYVCRRFLENEQVNIEEVVNYENLVGKRSYIRSLVYSLKA